MENQNAPTVEPTDTVDSLNEILDAADEVENKRGAQKKKRQAVRKRFASASNRLVMESAKLLGLVKTEWKLGSDEYMSIDMTKFDDKQTGSPEELGLFLGLKDKWTAAGVNVTTLAFSLSGQINSWGKALDQKEVPQDK
jgi:hypothetical protein